MADAMDPAALAAKIAAGLRAGLEQDPHVVACTPGLIGIVATYLDAAAPMIAAALERDALARDLAAAQARVAELEGERDASVERGAALERDFDAAMHLLWSDEVFVGTHWEGFPDLKKGMWPALCAHVSNYGADAEEVPREHWPLLASLLKKHGNRAADAYACWRRGVNEPGKGKLDEGGRAALAELRALAEPRS